MLGLPKWAFARDAVVGGIVNGASLFIIETAKKPKKKPEPSAEPKVPDASLDESASEPQKAETESVESADGDAPEESVSD